MAQPFSTANAVVFAFRTRKAGALSGSKEVISRDLPRSTRGLSFGKLLLPRMVATRRVNIEHRTEKPKGAQSLKKNTQQPCCSIKSVRLGGLTVTLVSSSLDALRSCHRSPHSI